MTDPTTGPASSPGDQGLPGDDLAGAFATLAAAPLRAPTSVEVIRTGTEAFLVIDGHRLPWALSGARAVIEPGQAPEVVVRLRAVSVTTTDFAPPNSPGTPAGGAAVLGALFGGTLGGGDDGGGGG